MHVAIVAIRCLLCTIPRYRIVVSAVPCELSLLRMDKAGAKVATQCSETCDGGMAKNGLMVTRLGGLPSRKEEAEGGNGSHLE